MLIPPNMESKCSDAVTPVNIEFFCENTYFSWWRNKYEWRIWEFCQMGGWAESSWHVVGKDVSKLFLSQSCAVRIASVGWKVLSWILISSFETSRLWYINHLAFITVILFRLVNPGLAIILIVLLLTLSLENLYCEGSTLRFN